MTGVIRNLFNKNYIENEEDLEVMQNDMEQELNEIPVGENDYELLMWLENEDSYHSDNKEINLYLGAINGK